MFTIGNVHYSDVQRSVRNAKPIAIRQNSTYDQNRNTGYDCLHRSSLRAICALPVLDCPSLALGLLVRSLKGPVPLWIIAWCYKNYFLGYKRWVTLASEPLSAYGGSCDILVIRSVDPGRTTRDQTARPARSGQEANHHPSWNGNSGQPHEPHEHETCEGR